MTPLTRINMEFSQHVCYQAMGHLLEAIREGQPTGLKVFGDWATIYPALSQLPEPARQSWFDFDHSIRIAPSARLCPMSWRLNRATSMT